MVLCYRRGKSLVYDRRLTIKDATPGNALLLAIAVAAAVAAVAAAVCYRPRGVGSRALWRRVVPRSASCTNRGRERTRGARGVQAGLEVVRRRQGRPLPRRPLGRAALRTVLACGISEGLRVARRCGMDGRAGRSWNGRLCGEWPPPAAPSVPPAIPAVALQVVLPAAHGQLGPSLPPSLLCRSKSSRLFLIGLNLFFNCKRTYHHYSRIF